MTVFSWYVKKNVFFGKMRCYEKWGKREKIQNTLIVWLLCIFVKLIVEIELDRTRLSTAKYILNINIYMCIKHWWCGFPFFCCLFNVPTHYVTLKTVVVLMVLIQNPDFFDVVSFYAPQVLILIVLNNFKFLFKRWKFITKDTENMWVNPKHLFVTRATRGVLWGVLVPQGFILLSVFRCWTQKKYLTWFLSKLN